MTLTAYYIRILDVNHTIGYRKSATTTFSFFWQRPRLIIRNYIVLLLTTLYQIKDKFGLLFENRIFKIQKIKQMIMMIIIIYSNMDKSFWRIPSMFK